MNVKQKLIRSIGTTMFKGPTSVDAAQELMTHRREGSQELRGSEIAANSRVLYQEDS